MVAGTPNRWRETVHLCEDNYVNLQLDLDLLYYRHPPSYCRPCSKDHEGYVELLLPVYGMVDVATGMGAEYVYNHGSCLHDSIVCSLHDLILCVCVCACVCVCVCVCVGACVWVRVCAFTCILL